MKVYCRLSDHILRAVYIHCAITTMKRKEMHLEKGIRCRRGRSGATRKCLKINKVINVEGHSPSTSTL